MKRCISVILSIILLISVVFTVPYVFAEKTDTNNSVVITNTFDESDWTLSDTENFSLATLDGSNGNALRYFKATSYTATRTGNDIRHYKIYNPTKTSNGYEDYKPSVNTTYKLTFRYNTKSYNNNDLIINVRGVENGTLGTVLNRAITIKKSLKLSEYKWDTAVVYFKTPATALDALAITFEWDGTYDITNKNTNFVIDDVKLETAPASFVVANTFDEENVDYTTINLGTDETVYKNSSTDVSISPYYVSGSNTCTLRANNTIGFRALRPATHANKAHFEIYDYSKGLGTDGKLQSFKPEVDTDYTITFDYKFARSTSQDVVINIRPVTVDGSGNRVLGDKIATAVSIPKNDAEHPTPAVWKTATVDLSIENEYDALAITVEASASVGGYPYFDNVVVSKDIPVQEETTTIITNTFDESDWTLSDTENFSLATLDGSNGNALRYFKATSYTATRTGNDIRHYKIYNPTKTSNGYEDYKPSVNTTYKLTFRYNTKSYNNNDLIINVRGVENGTLGTVLNRAITIKKSLKLSEYKWDTAVVYFKTPATALDALAITFEWDGTYDITNKNTNFVIDDVKLETAPASFVVANTFDEENVDYTTINLGTDETVYKNSSTDVSISPYYVSGSNTCTLRANNTIGFRALRPATHANKAHFEIYDYSKGLGTDGKLQSFKPEVDTDYTITFDYKFARSTSQDVVINIRPVTVDGSGNRVLGDKIATAVSIPKNDAEHPTPAVWKTATVDLSIKNEYDGLAITVEASATVAGYPYFDNVVVSKVVKTEDDEEPVFTGTYFENTYEEEELGNTTANYLSGTNIFHLGTKTAAEREGRVLQFYPITGKDSIASGRITHVKLYNPNSPKFAPVRPKVGTTYKITFDFKAQVKDNDIYFNIRGVKDDELADILATAVTVKKGDPYFTGKYAWGSAVTFVTISEELSALAISIESSKQSNVNYYPYLDNIAVSVVPDGNTTITCHYGNSSKQVTLPNTTLFEDIPVESVSGKKFEGWYLDANLTIPAKENIYGHTEVWAKWRDGDVITNTYDDNGVYYGTDENGYINRYSDEALTTKIDGSLAYSHFAKGSVVEDEKSGTAMQLHDTAIISNTNPSVVRIYDNTKSDKALYVPRQNTVYKISFDIKSTAILDYDTHVAVKAHSNISGSFGKGEFLQYLYTIRDGVTVKDWTKVEGYITIPDAKYDFLGISLATTKNSGNVSGAEVWIDNVVLTEVMDVNYITIHPENGEDDTNMPFVAGENLVTIPQVKKDGYVFAGWFIDSAKKSAFTYDVMPNHDIEIYAKWIETSKNAIDFSTGFETDDFNSGVTPYTNTGSNNKYTNNMSIHAAVLTDESEAYNGDKYLHFALETNSSKQTMDMASIAVINPDGTNFEIKSGERYRFKLALRSDYDCYIVPVVTGQVPTGKLNFNNSTEISRIYYRGSIYHAPDTWGEMEVYFTPSVSGKVSFLVYLAGATYFDIDNVSIEVMDSSEASLVEFYNEAGSRTSKQLGGIGNWLFTPVPAAKSGYVFDGWYDSQGNQYTKSVFPEGDLKLYPRYREAEDLSNPETFKDGTLTINFDGNDGDAQAYYQSGKNSFIDNKDAILVTDDPDGAHSGGNYLMFHNAGQWTKSLYRRFRLYDENSIGNRVYLEPYSVYRVGFWLKVDKTKSAVLRLATFDNTDGVVIVSDQSIVSLTEAEAESTYGEWIYYEGDITTGDAISTLGIMLSGGFTTASIDDFTVRKLTTKTVSFESNGGSEVKPIETLEGQYIVAPEEPTKDGFVFAGWYSDAELKNEFDFNGSLINEDIKLYAKWTAVKKQEYKEVTTYVTEEVTEKNEITDAHLDDKLNVSKNDTIGKKPAAVEPESNSWLLIVIIIAGVLALAATSVVIIIVLKKRRRKFN